MVVPVYLPADRRGDREGAVQEHGAVVEDLVAAPRLPLDLRPSENGRAQGPLVLLLVGFLEGVVRGAVGPLLFLLGGAVGVALLLELLELPGVVGVGELEGAAVVRVGQPGFFY